MPKIQTVYLILKLKYQFMKTLFTIIILLASVKTFSQDSTQLKFDPSKKVLIVDASCGQCQFKMEVSGCTLAIRINKKTYFVEKANIDAFGDAHAEVGFCNSIRKAKVQGIIVNNKFVASYFELIDKK